MNSDHHFWIGTKHKVCEDYALSSSQDNLQVAVVCDGCSSSIDTDIGSRLIARAALQHIDKIEDPSFGKVVISAANIQARALGLPFYSLNVTLLVAVAYDNKYTARCYGDGAIAIIKKDGTVSVNEYVYPSGAPRYLTYSLDSNMHKAFIEQFGEKHFINKYDLSFGSIGMELREEMDDDTDPFTIGICNNIKAIILMSDGFGSFYQFVDSSTSRNMIEIPNREVYEKALGFKGLQGKFVERRAKKFILDCEKMGWMNGDDCSMAAINLEN